MFYRFTHVVISVMLRIFFRRIYVAGAENIKADKPQLLASNHPNGFIEPLVMACHLPKPLYFLVRGDVFDNPFLRPMLRATNQIPIFRFRDGFSRLRENAGTIDESIQVLLQRKNLLIFAEGGTESIKKLRPLQKGVARIAFQVLEKDPSLPLEILPVGVNFTYPTVFGEELMLRVGKPILVKDYWKVYTEDKNKAIEQLLADLAFKMEKNVVHLDDQHRIHVFEKVAAMQRSDVRLPYVAMTNREDHRLNAEKKLASNIDALDAPALENIRKDISVMDGMLRKSGNDFSYFSQKKGNIAHILLIAVLALPSLAGMCFHGLALLGAQHFTASKVKHKEFRLSILLVSSLALTTISYIILGCLWALLDLPAIGFLIIPFTGLSWYAIYMLWKGYHFRSLTNAGAIENQKKIILDYVK